MNESICFKISKHRKVSSKSNFDPSISEYWQMMIEDMFRRWHE